MRLLIFPVIFVLCNCLTPSIKHLGKELLRGTKLLSTLTEQDTISNNHELELYIRNGPIPVNNRVFLINGWKWHTSSLLRDLKRFSNKARDEEGQNTVPIRSDTLFKCYEFVCQFSQSGLCRIEREIFFPWLERLLPKICMKYLNEVRQNQLRAVEISKELSSLCAMRMTDSDPVILKGIIEKVDELESHIQKIQFIQTQVFIPVICAYVPREEQMRFNRRVILCLGPMEAQVHLVGMAETIRGLPAEEQLLRSQIPKIAQAMLPLWKRRFYLPRTKCLEEANR